jgi:hypothetical protein
MIANKSQVIIDARASDMCFSFRSRVVVLQLCFLMLAHPPVSVDFCTTEVIAFLSLAAPGSPR